MSHFKVHENKIKLPSTLEVDKLIIRGTLFTPAQIYNAGIVYSNNGVLIHKGANGTITLIANT